MTNSVHINPEGMHSNPAFTQAVKVPAGAETIYVGGQNGVDGSGQLVGDDLASQAKQALANISTCLDAAGGSITDVVKWTIYLVDGQDLRQGFAAFGEAWGDQPNPPAISVAKVAGLAYPAALVEVEAVAAIC